MTRFRKRSIQLHKHLLSTALAAVLCMGATLRAAEHDYSGTLSTLPKTSLSFAEVYQENKRLAIGDYITFDLFAHAFTRLWHESIHAYEQEIIEPLLRRLIEQWRTILAKQPESAVTQANRDFADLLHSLLNQEPSITLSATASAELKLVEAAAGPIPSPLFGYTIDYTQFTPRAAYAESAERARFFRTYRYAATVLFPLRPSAALGLRPEQAQQLSEQLKQLAQLAQTDTMLAIAVGDLQKAVSEFFPGRSSSIDLAFLIAALSKDAAISGSHLLEQARQKQLQPEVIHGVVDRSALEPELSARDALTGFRLVPLQESLDSRIFQSLIYDATGAWLGKNTDSVKPLGLGQITGFGPAKVRPLVDEFVAALDVPPLTEKLTQAGEQNFADYAKAWTEAGRKVAQIGGAEALRVGLWQQYLMAADASLDQRIETVKGMWTEFKHAELLYQAQAYTVTSKGISVDSAGDDPAARGATIEAVPDAFTALLTMGTKIADAIPSLRPRWTQLNAQLTQAIELAKKVRDGGTLTLTDEAFLRALPKQLMSLSKQPSKPLVVDIHSHSDGRQIEILYAAIGYAREQVIMQNELPMRGARYHFYSFSRQQPERLTDAAWQAELSQQIPSEQRHSAWRRKLAPELEREMVLAHARADSKAHPINVQLSKEGASELSKWASAHKIELQSIDDTTVLLELPLRVLPELARKSWVTRLELITTIVEPMPLEVPDTPED